MIHTRWHDLFYFTCGMFFSVGLCVFVGTLLRARRQRVHQPATVKRQGQPPANEVIALHKSMSTQDGPAYGLSKSLEEHQRNLRDLK